ncbi:YdcF family protein [Anaerobaca lacustris]|uniref:YdcF family protein n=1 Tax=Anaerobaca lacustris TaxID=3044600 RepID=A0AAW6U5Q0_9BACT|nr:YdcF family protein [Sedimentisphaerales bacterium M17dextr]
MFVIKSFATPLVWILVLSFAGLVLLRFSRRKTAPKVGWVLVLLATLLLLILSFPPFANALTYSVESRVPMPDADVLSTLDVIVVLGGGGFPSGGFRTEAELSGRSYPRLYHGVRLFQQGHADVIAFCGGEIREGKEREAEIMKAMAVQMGVPAEKILTETTSATTQQNASGLAELLPAAPNRRIGIVTSATHALRSVRTFAAHFPDDTVVPVPVHYQYDPDPWHAKNLRPTVDAFVQSTGALHEWIGLLWYRVRY